MKLSIMRRRRTWFVIGVIGLATVGGAIWLNSGPVYRADVGQRIADWANPAHVGSRLRLADVTDFAWDRVLILAPYATDEEARRQLGFDWHVEDESYNEGVNLVGFASGDRVIVWTKVSRGAELLPHNTLEGGSLLLSRDAAVFVWTGFAYEVVP